MSLINKGENHPMFGLQHKEETKEKIKNKMLGSKNPRFGKKLSEETKELISINSSKGLVEIRDIKKNLLHTCKNASAVANKIGIHKTTVSRYIKSGKLFDNKYYFILLSKSL